jgi:hypothetical protein
MKYLSIYIFLIFPFVIKAQTPESLLDKIQIDYTPEKIYIHYDKSNYVAGETIWFKAYLMDGFVPSKKSTIISVELLNELDIIIDKKNLSINGSAAIGQFETDKLLPNGNYTVRAFTRNLMNFGTDKFYYNTIQIYNPNTINTKLTKIDEPSIKFLPESGNFIANIKNNVAFVCTDMQGKPLNISGKILDENKKEIVSFSSVHNGMGTVIFTPTSNMKYSADCIIGKDFKKSVSLPISITEGVSLQINRKNDKTFFTVDLTTVSNENLLPSYILGIQENAVAFKVDLQQNSKLLGGEIPMNQLPTGILQITVFNKANKPLAERLIFVNSGDYKPKDNFKIDTLGLGKREKNTFSYAIDDTLVGTFSVSIIEEDGEDHKNENIVSRFLLTDDLKGYVHDPNYYFEKNDFEHAQYLDLVMLTNGWRRYSWSEIFSGNYPAMKFKDPNYISIYGEARNGFTKELLKDVELKSIIKTKDKQIDYANFFTSKEGKFEFEGLNFEDTATFAFKNTNLILDFKSEPIERLLTVAKSNLPKVYDLIAASNSLIAKTRDRYNLNKLGYKGIILDEVVVKSIIKNERKEIEKKRSSQFGNSANKTLDLSTTPASGQNILEYLKSRLNGVNITGGPFDYFINYRNTRTLIGGQIPMSVFLDGAAVEPSQIATLKVDEVAMVQVFSTALSPNSGGTLAIFTGEKSNFTPGNGTYTGGTALVVGFSPTKEFFSPNYSNEYDNSTVQSDNRTTLYWNPYLNTNAQNKSFSFSFYNSDIVKKFRVVLEGVLEDGKLVHIEKVIE